MAGLDRFVRYARPPMLISVRGPAVRRTGDMMVIGWFPLVKAFAALGVSRPSTRTGDVAAAVCGELAAAHR